MAGLRPLFYFPDCLTPVTRTDTIATEPNEEPQMTIEMKMRVEYLEAIESDIQERLETSMDNMSASLPMLGEYVAILMEYEEEYKSLLEAERKLEQSFTHRELDFLREKGIDVPEYGDDGVDVVSLPKNNRTIVKTSKGQFSVFLGRDLDSEVNSLTLEKAVTLATTQ